MVEQSKRILRNLEKFVERMAHSRNETSDFTFELSMDDYTIILNALHYYKKVEKYPEFSHYTEERINQLRDKMAYQLIPSPNSKPKL